MLSIVTKPYIRLTSVEFKKVKNKRDDIYSRKAAPIGSFKFDDSVATVFDDMISRSVPGYQQILGLLPTLTKQFSFPEKNYYDLGCSTGAGLLAMANGLQDVAGQLIGIDNSPAMLQEAKVLTEELASHPKIKLSLLTADINAVEITNAAMVLMNFTLQFIPIEKRGHLLSNIYSGLTTGGALVLSEKIKPSDSLADQLLTKIHHQFKADQGYSSMEISKKRDAIENVLIPESLEDQLQRLQNTGFSIVTPWVQNLQFVSILAIK